MPHKAAPPPSRELINTISYGTVDHVKALLVQDVDLNADIEFGKAGSMTLLFKAIIRGDAGIVALLLDHGADIEARRSYNGFTPLMQATRNDHPDIVKLLLDRGADKSSTSYQGQTALEIALDCSMTNAARILRETPQQPAQKAMMPLKRAFERSQVNETETRLRAAAAKKPKARFKQGGFPTF